MRFLFLILTGAAAWGATVTDLWLRGHAVVPTPRSVRLASGDVYVDGTWRLEADERDIAARALRRDLLDFHGTRLGGTGGGVIRLAVAEGAVATGADAALDRQAYRLRIEDGAVEVTGNAAPGLFYGVQTLVQLLKRDPAGRLLLPKGTIEDWPRLQLRFLHWDTKHHQDRMETLKRYLDWAARFKANMIGFELEDKFEYPSLPEVGAPGAFTTAELQEIVNYGLERHIQVVPVIQAPAHMSYVLKHPRYAALAADGNNYQSAMCNPRTYDLIFSMYDDVVRATKGVDYLFASTDEVYYAGIEAQCARPYNPENRSLQWVEFVRRAREHLAAKGRRMLIWAEYPLLPKHAAMIPPDVIDGVIGEPEYLATENRLGIRQLAYVSMQGEELLFPSHLDMDGKKGRLEEARRSIATGRHWQGKPIGSFGAAWDDSGLHNETFWLGWSAAAHYGWNPEGAPAEQHAAEFMRIYYGQRAPQMMEVYRLIQRQARAWESAWDSVVSRVRGPVYGNSRAKGFGTERYDRTLALPRLPAAADLAFRPSFAEKYGKLLAEAPARLEESYRLAAMLQESIGLVERNPYNLEVFLALAHFMGHHWNLLGGLAEAERSLVDASAASRQNQALNAMRHMVAAHNRVDRLRKEGEQVFTALTAVWEKSRFPNGREVDGRKFVQVLDDTKDHWAGRTADWGYMMAPERSIGLDRWQKELAETIRAYCRARAVKVDWRQEGVPEE